MTSPLMTATSANSVPDNIFTSLLPGLIIQLNKSGMRFSSLELFSSGIYFCNFAKNPKKNQPLISDLATKHAGNIDPKIIISKYEEWFPTKINGL